MGLFGKIGEVLANPGKLFGTNNDIGNALNDITGTSDSARQQYKYNQALQNEAQKFNADEAEKTRAFNAVQAQIERDWQTQMSNTARQRAVSDLQSAGINPILAAGASADAGAGAVASGGQATSPGASTGAGSASANPISMITELINASNNSARTKADIKNETAKTNAEIKNINANTRNTNQNTQNGGTGGTSFTRTVDWSARQIKKAKEKQDKILKNLQEKGKSLSWTDFKQKLKSK